MSEFKLEIAVSEENSDLFKRCIRKLLDSTFILKDKDEKFYRFATRPSNRMDLSEYLKVMGFDLSVDEKTGVCMLIASEEDRETVGLKRASVITFTALQYHLLLVLWKVYLENLGLSEGNYISKGDLIDKIKAYEVSISKNDLNTAFKLFKKYQLIDYDEHDEGENMPIRLYPSLQFGWQLPQFKLKVQEYLDKTDDQEMDEALLTGEGDAGEEGEKA